MDPESDFAELFRIAADGLYRFALVRLRHAEEAEDAVQDAFLRLCRRADDPRDFDNPRAWMFRVLESVCLDRRRASHRRDRMIAEQAVDPSQKVDPWLASTERKTAVSQELTGALRGLQQMPEIDAVALILVAVEGMSYADVADIMRVPIGTVRSRVSRARQTLRERRDKEAGAGGSVRDNVVSMTGRMRRGSE